jgi:hypothetical protein
MMEASGAIPANPIVGALGDRPGDMGAVTVGVGGDPRAGQVVEGVVLGHKGSAEAVAALADPGVEHGDRHPGPNRDLPGRGDIGGVEMPLPPVGSGVGIERVRGDERRARLWLEDDVELCSLDPGSLRHLLRPVEGLPSGRDRHLIPVATHLLRPRRQALRNRSRRLDLDEDMGWGVGNRLVSGQTEVAWLRRLRRLIGRGGQGGARGEQGEDGADDHGPS